MEEPSKLCEFCGTVFYNTRLNKNGHRIRRWTKKQWDKARFCSFSCRSKIIKNRLGTGKSLEYSATHKWVKLQLGERPEKCKHCGVRGKMNGRNWSIHYANIDGKYRRNKKDYIPLCTNCHRLHDKRT